MTDLAIVCASHDMNIYRVNLGSSNIVQWYGCQVMTGFTNIPEAYNRARTMPLTIYSHHDVFIPQGFEIQARKAIRSLPKDWGVCGVAGVNVKTEHDAYYKTTKHARTFHGHIEDRGTPWGRHLVEPMKVQTLDELLLIVKQGNGLKFDEQFDLHFYGADICMQAHAKGLGVYVIPGYVKHNSGLPFGHRSQSFHENAKRFTKKWRDYLPIGTTCTICS